MGFKYANKLWSFKKVDEKSYMLEQVGGSRVLLVNGDGVHECASADKDGVKRGTPLTLFDCGPATLVRLDAYAKGDGKAVSPETFAQK